MSRGNATGSSPPFKGVKKAAPLPSLPALKPRPRLLIALSLIFAIWVGGLLAMYLKTVRPYRHDPARNAPEVDQ